MVVAAGDELGPALDDHLTDVRSAIHDEDVAKLYVDVTEPLAERAALSFRAVSDGAAEPAESAGGAAPAQARKPTSGKHTFRAATPVSAARSLAEAEPELEKQVRSGYVTVVAFERIGEAERARYGLERLTPPILTGGPAPVSPGVLFAEAPVADGFISPELKLAVIPHRRLVHRRRAAAPAPSGGRLASLGDLAAGEHVVHEDHGVARFAGFDTRTVAGITRDYLELEYRDGDKVLVPAEQLAKITRYVGGGEHPELSKLGGKRWQQMKTRARRAAREMAGELINLYAERQARSGHRFSPDGEWQLRLERSFPYRETADQLEAIEAVKADMESERPMDRLICGDVGYGKTEVAIRAAQKALADSKQVMILVPTTILATQHLGTFSERLRDFPYEIEMISRLRKPAETKAALAAFADGSLDILIGTHRLLSRDVRAKDLGLLVIDEEQRFGVKQKELLRQLKLRVDVLSMSATPIPRTMQMSLAGLRDISVIETPPEGRRPVRTYIGPYDEELVSGAIKREVARDGQAFFLHNRIETLHDTAERLRALVPHASFLEAHGQLNEGELETTMLSFLRGEADVLVATTIIESGLDVPAANTLIVERADNLGLAQAYQIRGRVGRSRERAYAYMLYPSEEGITREAAARGWRRWPTTPSSARASGSRCATSSSAEPGICSAPSSPAMSPRSASSSTSRCSTRRSPSCVPPAGRGGADRGGGAGRHRRLGVRPVQLRSLRGGEDRHPPAHRRLSRAGRVARAAGRDGRPLRPPAGAGRDAPRRSAGADRARPRGGAQPLAPRGAAARRAAGAGLRARRQAARAHSRGCLQLSRWQPDAADPRRRRSRLRAHRRAGAAHRRRGPFARRGRRRCMIVAPGGGSASTRSRPTCRRSSATPASPWKRLWKAW